MNIRVGFGFDTHVLQAGKDFWLGGIKIPAAKGAVGHSDADVLIHALCDALLGAAGKGDIGTHFSNTDVRWKDMASKYFLESVLVILRKEGWSVENVDCVVCLERPVIAPHVPRMRKGLAALMGISENAVSVKATTNERMGYVGREEGVNAYAVALIANK